MNRLFFYLWFVFILTPITTLGQISIEPDRPFVPIEKGKSGTIIFTLKSGGTSMVPKKDTFNDTELDFKKESSTGTTVTYKFTGNSSLPIKRIYIIGFTVDGTTDKDASVEISVIDPSKFDLGGVTEIKDAVQNKEKQLRMTVPGTTIENNRVDFDGYLPNPKPSYANGIIKFKPNTKGKFNLIVKVDGINVKTLPVDVAEGLTPLKVNKVITLKQDEEIKISNLGLKLTGADGTDFTATKCATPTITPDPDAGIIDAGSGKWKVNPAKRVTTGFTVSCDGASAHVSVTVEAKASKIEFTPSVATLRRNSESVVVATVKGTDGEDIDGRVIWKLKDTADGEYVEMIEEGDNRLRLRLRKIPAGDDTKQIVITATSGDGFPEDFRAWTERTFEVTDFAMLRMYLDPLDSTTLKNDFGSQLYKNYFVMKATLNNIVPNKDGEYYRAPILVYNQSIEAKVMIEYQDPWDNKWKPARQTQLIPNLIRTEAPKPTEDRNDMWRNTFNWLDKQDEGDYLVIPERRVTDLKKCQVVEQLDYMYPIQPLKYETILLTQESRENGKWKHKILTALLGLSSLTSFITNIVGAGGDWPLGQTQFSNLMIPSYQKFFPDRREIHKDHLIQEMMLPLLEVPFGSQESKYLLFPKGEQPVSIPIKRKTGNGKAGTWDSSTIKKIRIIGVSASDACANVAVIKKTN